MNTEDFFHTISQDKIPVLAPGALTLLKVFSDENLNYQKLAINLQLFPGISAKLIALANSPWSAPIQEITSIEACCSRLGLKVVKTISIALAVSASFRWQKCSEFEVENFWAHTLLTAELTTLIAPLLQAPPKIEIETLRTAALLQNLGLLFLVHQFPQATGEVLAIYKDNPEQNLNQLFIHKIGAGISDCGTFLANHWGLPRPLQVAMSNHHYGDYEGEHSELVSLLAITSTLVSDLYHHSDKQELCIASHLNAHISQAHIEPLIKQIRQHKSRIDELIISTRW